MPAHTTLSSLFTDIANAIRAKDGSSATIVADNFPAKILAIPTGITPTGTVQITTNGTHDIAEYDKAEVNVPTGTQRTASDVTVSGATVSVPAGLYGSAVSKSVASGSAGTPTATKGSVSNHSITVIPQVTNTTGYITGGTKTGNGVTVYASELVSGSETKTENGTYDVTNLASVVVNVSGGGGVPLPSTITPGDTPVAIGFVTNPNDDFIFSTTAKKIPGEEITIKRAGTYRFKATAQCETTTGTYALYIYKNNSLVHTETKASGLDAFSVSADIACNVGDIIDLRARSRSTSYFLWCPCFVACINWDNSF